MTETLDTIGIAAGALGGVTGWLWGRDYQLLAAVLLAAAAALGEATSGRPACCYRARCWA